MDRARTGRSSRWLTKVAHALRTRDLPVSSAHVIEAVRLAETLAGLRGRPLAGLAEVTEATRAVLCDGDELAVRYVTDQLVVGQALGSVSPDVPTVPLEADLVATCRTLRIRREADRERHDLDLRRSIDQARSRLFHRLRLLELGLDRAGRERRAGPGHVPRDLGVVLGAGVRDRHRRGAVWGTTVDRPPAPGRVTAARDGSLLELTEAVERCLLAQLPEALAGCWRRSPTGRPWTPTSCT